MVSWFVWSGGLVVIIASLLTGMAILEVSLGIDIKLKKID